MNVLVTGANGQLGSELKELTQHSTFNTQHYNFYFTTSKDLNIIEHEKVREYIELHDIKIIINCAAYTAVDQAEKESQLANEVNNLAVDNIGKICQENNIKLVHISTDYVFDGTTHKPYIEENETNPQSVYGQTKLDGEIALQNIGLSHAIIIRTSWVYSSFGSNFVKTMLRLGKERDELGVIFDQVGTPTYARDLAKAILVILPNIQNETLEIYHYSNEGVASWYDFAKEIMHLANLNCDVNPIETKSYPTPAKRPHYSLLNKTKIKERYQLEIPHWKDSLRICLKIMRESK